jgi:hypothetical protein
MKGKKHMKTITNIIQTAVGGFLLACVAALPDAQAVVPPPDGGYPGFNTAEGQNALFSLTTGFANTAVGGFSLFSDTQGNLNTAIGAGTLLFNTGDNNTATGALALLNNTTGANNTAVGAATLQNSTGEFNTALGANAGTDPDIGSNNVYIGDPGFPGDENVISIGGIAASGTPYEACYIGGIFGASVNTGTALPVYVDTDGHLGTVLANANGTPSAAPLRRGKGVQHEAMLNRNVEKLQATTAQQQKQIAHQQRQISQQQKQIEVLMAQLKEQATQIQKVSAQIEVTKPALQVVNNP